MTQIPAQENSRSALTMNKALVTACLLVSLVTTQIQIAGLYSVDPSVDMVLLCENGDYLQCEDGSYLAFD